MHFSPSLPPPHLVSPSTSQIGEPHFLRSESNTTAWILLGNFVIYPSSLQPLTMPLEMLPGKRKRGVPSLGLCAAQDRTWGPSHPAPCSGVHPAVLREARPTSAAGERGSSQSACRRSPARLQAARAAVCRQDYERPRVPNAVPCSWETCTRRGQYAPAPVWEGVHMCDHAGEKQEAPDCSLPVALWSGCLGLSRPTVMGQHRCH